MERSDGTHSKSPSWRALHADTGAWAEAIQFKFFREAPAWRKLAMAGDLNQGMLLFTESGLRNRHPDASPAEIRRLLADLLLGPELATKVYGPVASCDKSSD